MWCERLHGLDVTVSCFGRESQVARVRYARVVTRLREAHDDRGGVVAPVPGTRRETLGARLRRYHLETSGALSGLLMGVPLTLAYVLGVLAGAAEPSERDFLLRAQVDAIGETAFAAVQVCLVLAFFLVVLVLRRRGRFHPAYFAPLVVESMFYAALVSLAMWSVVRATGLHPVLGKPRGAVPLVGALGEAVNEETVCRWLALELLGWLFGRVLELPRWLAAAISVVVAASAYAIVGSLLQAHGGDVPPTAFATLLVSGLLLGALYWLRGYPACAYTHMFYATFWQGVLPHLS